GGDRGGSVRHGDVRVQPCERREDGTHVAGPVVADGDLHNTPFVEGIPDLSAFTAVRSARPTALNAASATWCSSLPVDSTCKARRPACARLCSAFCASPGSHSRRTSAHD